MKYLLSFLLGFVLLSLVLIGVKGSIAEPVHPVSISKASAKVISSSSIVGCVSSGGLPDPFCTPGYMNPDVNDKNIDQTICVSGYSATVRPSVSVTNPLKADSMAAYNIHPVAQHMKEYEGDHFIPIEDGGCPGPNQCGTDFRKNFWPESWTGPNNAHDKDKVENLIHQELCAHKITLDRVIPIMNHWIECRALLASGSPCL